MHSDLPPEIFNRSVFEKMLHKSSNPISLYKKTIKNVTEFYNRQFLAGVYIRTLIHGRARFIDEILDIVWQQYFKKSDPYCLVAVGGYGRGELHPCSDIDLLILVDENGKSNDEALEGFIRFLWDIGLEIGSSVRSVRECVEQARLDITIVTNVMESRALCGKESLYKSMMQLTGPDHIWPADQFFTAKMEEQRNRHIRLNDTEYNLEPNIKSSPGGLRDQQTVGWIAKRHLNAQHIDELVTNGFLTAEEFQIFNNGLDFLWKVRYGLHMLSGRAEDRLIFDYQRKLAKIFAYEDNDQSLGVEQFMKQYFRWALALTELSDVLTQHFSDSIIHSEREDIIEPLNDRFQLCNKYIEVIDPDLFQKQPSALLEIFVLLAQNPEIIDVRAATIRLIRDNRHLIDEDFCNDSHNNELFLDLLRSHHRVAQQLKRMKRYGVLGKFIPAFGEIIGQTQHDLFHIYTVDAHTMLVIKNMRRFGYPDMYEKFPVASDIYKSLPKVELLFLAGLFHDIGKGRGGDHSLLGSVDALDFCLRLGLPIRDAKLVSWLVKQHLLMSTVSQKQDISDPDVIAGFAEIMGNKLHLDYLFVLTVADINATNPTLWNSWRASLMRQLYQQTRRVLRHGTSNNPQREEWINDTKEDVFVALSKQGYGRQQIIDAWNNPGDDYFLRESTEDIIWHTESILQHKKEDKALVLIKETSTRAFEGATQIFIHTKNRDNLFALVASTLEQLNLNIQDARIYNSDSDYTLDTFFVLAEDGDALGDAEDRLKLIRKKLENQLNDDQAYAEVVIKRTPRQLKYFAIPTKTNMTIDETRNQSVLEVVTPDRAGLLATLGQIFVDHNLVLQNAKIATLGERVEDIFYLTNKQGTAITDPEESARIQASICEQLDKQAAAS